MCCYTTLWNVKCRKTSNNLNQVSCLTINQQIFNELHEPYPRQLMQSQQLLKMSSSSPNAGTQASVPLVNGIVNHVLLQSSPDLNQSLSQLVHVLHFFSGRPNLASLPKSCNLLGWDLGYSEATDQVRWMWASTVAAAWLSRMPCVLVHCLVGTRRSRQTPAIWQVTTVDSEAPHGSSNR